MQYRIISTTDHQHRGKIIDFDIDNPGDIFLGDITIETLFVTVNDDGTLTVGNPNYLLTLRGVD